MALAGGEVEQGAGHRETALDLVGVVEQRRRDAHHPVPHRHLDLRRHERSVHLGHRSGGVEGHDGGAIGGWGEEPVSLPVES
ncbi:MAG: hypothetical protein ABI587_09995 [Gemmatimonadales bacterium]